MNSPLWQRFKWTQIQTLHGKHIYIENIFKSKALYLQNISVRQRITVNKLNLGIFISWPVLAKEKKIGYNKIINLSQMDKQEKLLRWPRIIIFSELIFLHNLRGSNFDLRCKSYVGLLYSFSSGHIFINHCPLTFGVLILNIH